MASFWSREKFKKELISKMIFSHFKEESIYLVLDRQNSGLLSEKRELFNSLLGKENFFLWDLEFKKTIELNRVGVLRLGHII